MDQTIPELKRDLQERLPSTVPDDLHRTAREGAKTDFCESSQQCRRKRCTERSPWCRSPDPVRRRGGRAHPAARTNRYPRAPRSPPPLAPSPLAVVDGRL